MTPDFEAVIPQIASRVRNFRKAGSLYRFSCPICGDSKRDKTKARAYIYRASGSFRFHCHNCQQHFSLRTFLKLHFPDLYREALLSMFKSKAEVFEPKVIARSDDPVIDLLLLPINKDLSAADGRTYLEKRQIPQHQWNRIFYTDDLRKLSCLKKEYLDVITQAERNILLPHFDRVGKLFAINARNIEPAARKRYMLMKIREDHETVYGLEIHDLNKKTYVTEGPFDSFFFPNALAVNTSDLCRVTPFVEKTRTVLIFDNQYRNHEVTKLMRKAAHPNHGFSLFVWPRSIKSKDVNEGIISKEISDPVALVDENTFSGPRLLLELTRRIDV